MNLPRFAIEHKTLTNFLVFLVVVGVSPLASSKTPTLPSRRRW